MISFVEISLIFSLPKKGSIFVRIICSFVSQVFSFKRFFTSLIYNSVKASKLISRSEEFCNWNIRSHSCASFFVAKPRLHFCLRSPFQFTYLAITYQAPLSSFLNTGITLSPFRLRRAFHKNTGG